MAKAKNEEVVRGSGNVFADLGFANADELLAKAQLVDAIAAVIKSRGLKQHAAADLIGVQQPKVSALLRGDTRGFSCERLMRILNALGQDVEITVKPARRSTKAHRQGKVRVI